MCWLYAAETHETFHWESGMRYQVSSTRPIRAQNEPISDLCPVGKHLIRTLMRGRLMPVVTSREAPRRKHALRSARCVLRAGAVLSPDT